MVLLLVGCVVYTGGLGGQSGSEGTFAPPYCVEESREAIDPDTLPDGFPVTPREVVDATAGDWAGWVDSDFTDAGILTDGSATLTWDSAPFELVHELLDGRVDSDGNELPAIADEHDCPTRFETTMAFAIQGDEGGLDEAFDVTLQTDATGYVHFEATQALADVAGNDRPPWDPSDWETNELDWYVYLGTREPISLLGQVTWRARTEDEAHHSLDETSEDCCGFAFDRP